MKRIKTYFSSEDGAVTVDWIVLTAGVIGFLLFSYGAVSDVFTGMAELLAGLMAEAEVQL